ncbi:transcription intermediary factor 1-alpha, putative, partial [Ixodes scapularis]
AVRCAECQQDISGQDVISHLFLMEHLASNSENKGSETAKTYTCTSCEDSASATGFCVDCQDWLCQTCIDAHQRVRVTKDHTIKTKDELEGEKPATLGQKYMFCENHKQEQLKLYCETCDKLTCRDCQLQEHKDHKYQFISSACEQQKTSLNGLLAKIREKQSYIEGARNLVSKRHHEITQQEQKVTSDIKMFAVRFITEINKRGKLLLQELNDICNKKKMQLSSKNEELMALSLKLAQCHKFAEAAINRGSDVALVFSKRTICNQMRTVLKTRCEIPNPQHVVDIKFLYEADFLTSYIGDMGCILVDQQPIVGNPPWAAKPPLVTAAAHAQHRPGPLNQKGQGPSMAALSHMARLGPPAMTGGAYAMQKVAPGGHPMHSPLQPGIRHPQQHNRPRVTGFRSSGNGPLPCPPPLATGVQIIPQPKTQVIMLDSTGAARAAALQQQRRMSATSSSSSGGTPPSTRIPSHLIQGGSPRLPEASVLERCVRHSCVPATRELSFLAIFFVAVGESCAPQRHQGQPLRNRRWDGLSLPGEGPGLLGHHLESSSIHNYDNKNPQLFGTGAEGFLGSKAEGASCGVQQPGQPGGQQPADSSCSPSSIAEAVGSPRTEPSGGGGGPPVQDCFEDLSTLEELLKIGDKSFSLMPRGGKGPTPPSSAGASRAPPQQNGAPPPEGRGAGLKIVETHSLQSSSDPNEDWCSVCHDGGELLCCGSCPRVYHLQCHVPSLSATPSEDWTCLLCLDILKCNIPRESAGSKRKTPVGLSGRELLICERILLHLFCHELSIPFHIPVSRTVPNYYKVITKPMDLTTIKQKLSPSHFNHYEDVPEYLADIKLIFKNCYTFNHKDSQVCQQARTLERDFDALVNKYLPEHFAELRDAQADPVQGYDSDPEKRKKQRVTNSPENPVVV